MIVHDRQLLRRFSEKCRCEHCGKRCPAGCDPAHVLARGLGGGGRLDVELNLVALCRADHRRHHDGGKPTRADLLAIVAKRNKMTAEDVQSILWQMQRNHSLTRKEKP